MTAGDVDCEWFMELHALPPQELAFCDGFTPSCQVKRVRKGAHGCELLWLVQTYRRCLLDMYAMGTG